MTRTELAHDVLRAIERSRGMLVVPKMAYAGWLFVRFGAKSHATRVGPHDRAKAATSMSLPIPGRPTDVTPAWLSAALSAGGETGTGHGCRRRSRRHRSDRSDVPRHRE